MNNIDAAIKKTIAAAKRAGCTRCLVCMDQGHGMHHYIVSERYTAEAPEVK